MFCSPQLYPEAQCLVQRSLISAALRRKIFMSQAIQKAFFAVVCDAPVALPSAASRAAPLSREHAVLVLVDATAAMLLLSPSLSCEADVETSS